MAVQMYQSRPAPGQLLLEGLAGGLGSAAGQQIGRGIGSLVGLGAEKIGLTGPSQEEINLLKNMGMSEEQAKGFYRLQPRAQQQILSNLAERQKLAKSQAAYGSLGEAQQSNQDLLQQMQESGVSMQEMQDLMKIQKPGEEFATSPEFMESPHSIYRNLTTSGLNPKEAKEFSSLYGEEFKERSKESKDFVKSAKSDLEGVQEEKPRYMRFYNMASKGEFPTAQSTALVRFAENKLGLHEGDLNSLLGASAEEATKILADTIKGAKSLFGSRITDADLSAWFKRLPSLLQSDEGKLRAINDLMIYADLKELRGNAVKDILKQTKGKIPVNIEDMVEERIEKKRDKLVSMFINGESDLPNYKKNLEKAAKKTAKEAAGAKIGTAAGGTIGGLIGSKAGSAIGSGLGGLAGKLAGQSALGSLGRFAGGVAGGIPGALVGGLVGGAAGSYAPQLLEALRPESMPSDYGIQPGIQGLFGRGPIA